MLLDLGRHLGVGDLFRELGDLLALGVVAFAELLDRSSRNSRWRSSIFFLGLLADLARYANTSIETSTSSRPGQSWLRADVDGSRISASAGDVHARLAIGVGSADAEEADWHGVDQLDGGLRQQLQDFDRLVAQMQHPRLDVLAAELGLGQALDPRHQKRVAVKKIDDAKAPVALADYMVLTVGARHIAQDVGLGAHPVQVDRDRVLGCRVALQDEPDRPVQADRRLRRGDRALAAERHRQHGAGEQHKAAGGDQDQGVGR